MEGFKTLSEYFKDEFGYKIAKIGINAGFSCPNRDNGSGGCLFCTDAGAGEFAGNPELSISEQIAAGKKTYASKWNCGGYIAYFQSFSNTYAPLHILRSKFNEAIDSEGIIGMAIATRPDCIDESVAHLLGQYNKRTFLWIELGFQTSNENTASLINRGYSNKVFDNAVELLQNEGIRIVVHLIAGLPGEGKKEFLESVKYVDGMKPWGIKLHSIYIQSNSRLAEYSLDTGFEPLPMGDYIDYISDAMILLDKNTILHRLTGDPDRRLLVKPFWACDKLRVLSGIARAVSLKSTSMQKNTEFIHPSLNVRAD
ncbi:MAG: TIGR01212 family radical SAM protein [Clostridia bacterium]